MPSIININISDEIHNRIVTLKLEANTGHPINYIVRVLFSDIGISTGIYPSDDKALIKYAVRVLEQQYQTATCLSDVTEIRLSSTNAPE